MTRKNQSRRNRQERRSQRGQEGVQPIEAPKIKADNSELKPLNEAQGRYISSINTNILTFAVGPAGTGKSWIATIMGADALKNGEIDKILITRPAVEAEEELGFLPGEIDDKFAPYMRPIRDILEKRLGTGYVEYMIKSKKIEALPLAYMRGHTFENCWVILDEAQNVTPKQMLLFLSRVGENCKVIIDGDLTQKDIPGNSGLADAMDRLEGLKGTAIARFDVEDIVRSGFTQDIIRRYNCYNKKRENRESNKKESNLINNDDIREIPGERDAA